MASFHAPKRLAALCVLMSSVLVGPVLAQNLLVNGGFEVPALPPNSPKLYAVGDAGITGWQVIGVGDVAVLNGSFSQAGLTFSHQEGVQSLDLTGLSNTDAGVAQTIATQIGLTYVLSFYVGNVQSTGQIWGTTSSVRVKIDDQPFAVATYSGGPADTLGWQRFDHSFTATSAFTTIAFFNLDGPSDNVNQIDQVSLVAVVPEPNAAWLLCAGAVLAWGGTQRRRTPCPRASIQR